MLNYSLSFCNNITEISKLSFEQRILNLGYNSDRSDVIIPATKIFLKTMKYSNSNELLVPRIGLADGIIRRLDKTPKYGCILN